jgi:hypothetical protein
MTPETLHALLFVFFMISGYVSLIKNRKQWWIIAFFYMVVMLAANIS